MADEESWRSRPRRGRGRGKGREIPRSMRATDTSNKPHSADVNAKASYQNTIKTKRMDLIASVSRSSGLEKDGDE